MNRGIVQSVEHQSPKLGVVGSNPPAPAKEKSQVEFRLGFFQLNPPSAEEIHLWWMKSLRDEICLAAGDGGGFDFF